MNYWLFKSEPDEYGIDDLAQEAKGFGRWEGVRNYQARNLLRDEIKTGDQVLFYHSSCKIPGVAGIAEVTRAAYPDPTQFEPDSPYYDAKSSPDQPRWFCVDVKTIDRFADVVSLKTIKANPALAEMVLVKQGRLSVQPVRTQEWQAILAMAGLS